MHHCLRRERTPSTRAHGSRRGSVLVEFSLVAFVLYLLMVVLLDFGRGSLATQTLQGAVDLMAQELARAPIKPMRTFEDLLDKDVSGPDCNLDDVCDIKYVRERIYDESFLVIKLNGQTPEQITSYFSTLPIVNQMLRPLMFRDAVEIDGEPTAVLRYPGAIVKKDDGSLSVLIPYMRSRDWSGGSGDVEELTWVRVVEEVKETEQSPSHFPINSSSQFRGIVNLRINYPYQAAAMTAYRPDVAITGPNDIALADDSSVVEGALPAGFTGTAVDANSGQGPYSGKYGLGMHHTFITQGTTQARPYRRLISVQAAARREVTFELGS